jgi:hypothetical protein
MGRNLCLLPICFIYNSLEKQLPVCVEGSFGNIVTCAIQHRVVDNSQKAYLG